MPISKEKQAKMAELQAELNELLQFKEQPYFKRLVHWVEVQRDELRRGVEESFDPNRVFKASGGLRVLTALIYLLNQEQVIREQLAELLAEEED